MAGKVHTLITRLEEGFLCLLLSLMIFLACLQILLRALFSGGFLWADSLLRYLVLWSGMFGAAVATKRGKHIALDVISYLLPVRFKPWLDLLIHLFSFLVSLALTYASVIFVRNEMEFGATALLSVPSWAWNLVFPLAFALIAIRFLAAAVTAVKDLAGISPGGSAQPGPRQ